MRKLARARLLHASLVVCGLGLTGLAQTGSPAQDWPQWRGPGRDAAVAASQLPSAWPEAFTERWKVDVGEGYSSPVVVAGRVFVHSRRDPAEIVSAIDARTGAVIWRQEYPAAIGKNSYASRMAKGPNATPLVADGRVVTFGASGKAHAWDAATGKPLWSRDFSSRVDTTKLFCGTAASPVLVAGAVVVQVGSDVHGGLVTALDPATGATRWEWTGEGPGYATPIFFETGGQRHLVTLTNRSVIALDPQSGKPLWTVPFPDEWHENIVTPVWTGSRLIVSGVRQGTRAFSLTRTGAAWAPAQVWHNADVTMYMSSPVLADGVVYGLSSRRKGQFVAIDAATGATRWATEGREGEHASILLSPSHVLFLTNAGSLVVATRSAAAFQAVRRYDLARSETWASPVPLAGDLLVRDATSLARLGAK